jgi:hypothetical protein
VDNLDKFKDILGSHGVSYIPQSSSGKAPIIFSIRGNSYMLIRSNRITNPELISLRFIGKAVCNSLVTRTTLDDPTEEELLFLHLEFPHLDVVKPDVFFEKLMEILK